MTRKSPAAMTRSDFQSFRKFYNFLKDKKTGSADWTSWSDVAIVTDAGHNRIGGVPVTFTVRQGGGNINGRPSATMNTDPDGRALAVLTLGTESGFDNNLVEATFPGNPGLPAAFVASAKAPGNAAETRITGAVLDNSNNPIAGVTVRLFLTHQGNNNNTPVQIGTPVQTDAQGQFLIHPAPVGYFKLMADGTTVPSSRGTFPTLEYDLVTVAGQNNTVGMPLYLPQLDTVNKLCVNETTGGTLTLPEIPGFSLTVAPGSATFPGGSRTGCVTVSMVNPDKVPMSPGFGQQPRFIVTIQPVGTLFNPPAPITMPNVDGLGPGQVTELYSYDHDLSAFTAIGTGTVSADGMVVRSDPGVGIIKAGWHCGGDPNPNGGAEAVRVSVSQSSVTVGVGGKKMVTATGSPLPSFNPAYTWVSANTAIATAPFVTGSNSQTHPNSANITGTAPGTTTVKVTYKCDSGAPHSTDVTVTVIDVKLSEVGWGGGNHTMEKTGTDTWQNDLFGVEGDTTIVNPIWIDSNTDGTTEKDDPVAFTKGSKPTLTQIKLKIFPSANSPVTAKLKVQSVSGSLNFQPVDVTLSGDSITLPSLTTNDTVGDLVDNSNYELHWDISYDGGTTYHEFAVSKHRVFVTFGTPSGYHANPGVTARRISRETLIARGENSPVTIAQKTSSAIRTDVGFDLNNFIDDTIQNHWAQVDTGLGCDCISLSVLAAKHLRMIGISATEGRAFPTGGNPPGDTDAGASEFSTLGGVDVILGFFAAGGFNRFEGFFEINDAGTRKAFTVDPVQGPILETTAAVSGDKLNYNVIKTSLTLIQGQGGNNGKQFWFRKMADGTIENVPLDPTSPIPFP